MPLTADERARFDALLDSMTAPSVIKVKAGENLLAAMQQAAKDQ